MECAFVENPKWDDSLPLGTSKNMDNRVTGNQTPLFSIAYEEGLLSTKCLEYIARNSDWRSMDLMKLLTVSARR